MRKITQLITLVLMIFILAQCNINKTNDKKSKVSQTKITGEKLIGEKLDNSREAEIKNSYGFVIVDSFKVKVNDGSRMDIILEKIKNWSDPGDFHRIIFKWQNKEKTFFNINGWIKANSYLLQYVPDFLNSNILKSNYIFLQKSSEKDTLLFAFGYVYASKAGLLTIFNLSRFNMPVMIFNDNFFLYDYKDINNDGNIDISITKFSKDKIIDNKYLNYFLVNGFFQSND